MGKSARCFDWIRQTIVGWTVTLITPAVLAAADDPFFDLDLHEVLDLEVTSVSKKPQTVSRAAAAVFVITADDIRRSGAMTIPDLLRMAPGIQVGQISANSWAVSSRGPSGRFTNKLLVLIDGRSVYTPTFSGVYWDVQDTVLADIERIEIIRGPGASLWGANAVDGVINIITKSAAATQGGLLTAAVGNEERGTAAVRYGGRFGDLGYWRIHAKGFERDGTSIGDTGRAGNDDWRQQRLGFRTDLAPGSGDSLTVQGDIYRGRSGETSRLNFLGTPHNVLLGAEQDVSGGNLLARWQHELSASDSFTWQTYVDHYRRDWPAHLEEKRDTFDLDFQYRTRRFPGHDLVLGAGYRSSRDILNASYSGIPSSVLPYATFSPTANRQELYSLFAQDDIVLSPELILTLGIKLEHNDYTGLETQPNARLLWTPRQETTLWTSVARAVRTPSRVDHDGMVNQDVLAPSSPRNNLPWPVLIRTGGSIAASESVLAYEAGWKQRLSPALSFDLALFYHDYHSLRSVTFRPPLCQPATLPPAACYLSPSSHILQVVEAGNDVEGNSVGFELTSDWRPQPTLFFRASLGHFSMRLRGKSGAQGMERAGSFPDWQGSLRMSWNPRPDTDVDFWLRRVGELTENAGGHSVPGYNELDLRLAWRPDKQVELALVGRNLLHRKHQEFVSELSDMPMMMIERSFFAQVNLKF